ncbi:membrane protein [Aliiroseovarius zhejiangensis]|uniref:Membrane protein n=2 Tax=Aliiroseovarius zhejiangensis TaxID=1632025 RepID=A0ABQ3IPE7_9RHOB|nr:membrane protein [Aliiroseovarius zhejiangensis]
MIRLMGRVPLLNEVKSLASLTLGTARDLAPIVGVVAVFQFLILRQPLDDVGEKLIGLLFVMAGLAIFIRGLELALFPIGESLADAFANKGSLFWLLLFAFSLGFGTTVAEPALIAVSREAARVMSDIGAVGASTAEQLRYADALRYTVAAAVGSSLVIGVMRILLGWPIHYLIIGGYVLVVIMTAFAPAEIIGIAYDSGGVTTSTVTVPLTTALGVGLASVIKGRNPMIDGFGLVAFASLLPIVFVLGFGIVGAVQ